MNAENGSAIFGKRDINKNSGGQIIIDPNGERALLYSSNYYDNYKEDGLPSSYSKPSETYEKDGQTYYHQGMLIDLTTPQIRFRSGKFEVNSEGHLTAKGGGSIAGWQIGDDILTGGNTTLNKNGTITVSNLIATTTGKIANFDFNSSRLSYNGKNDFQTVDQSGIYIGQNGISMGLTTRDSKGNLSTPFSVATDGTLIARSGKIGGWTITDTGLENGIASLNVYSTGSEANKVDYGILTIPYVKIPDNDTIYNMSPDSDGAVLGWFKGAIKSGEQTIPTQVIGIASGNKSIVLESFNGNIRLSVPSDNTIYLESVTKTDRGERIYNDDGLKFNNHYIYARFK